MSGAKFATRVGLSICLSVDRGLDSPAAQTLTLRCEVVVHPHRELFFAVLDPAALITRVVPLPLTKGVEEEMLPGEVIG